MSNSEIIKNCSNCRHHAIQKVPKTVEVGFDEYIESSDEEVDSYICKHPSVGKNIGRIPILCDQWDKSKPASQEQLDSVMERFNSRNR